MEMNTIMQWVSYLLIAIGVMAFVVSVITQVIKSWNMYLKHLELP